MRKRFLTFLLGIAVSLGIILGSISVSAGAIVPLGLVQSALASYVTSTGYKMYNDQGTGQDIISSLSDLYQTWLDSPAGQTAAIWTLGHIAEIEAVYMDSSGQIVIKKAAADIFQEFAEWIQTEYSVTAGSDTPTQVVQASGGTWTDGNGINCVLCTTGDSALVWSGRSYYIGSPVVGTYSDPLGSVSLCLDRPNFSYYATQYDGLLYFSAISSFSGTLNAVTGFDNNGRLYTIGINSISDRYPTYWVEISQTSSDLVYTLPSSSVRPSGLRTGEFSETSIVAGLGVTLAQAVTDVVGQAADDDALVIGVGAGVGATAQDIADAVASGVKAQTLEPSVSIVAESVIDTPVQPYPDIDGLGLPELGAALVDRFPFCIPWDFVDTIKLLNAEPVAPNIHIDILPAGLKARVGITADTSFDLNLGTEQYSKIGVFCRWISLISFCFALVLLTKRIVWTA